LDKLEPFIAELDALLANMAPQARRTLTRELGRQLRQSQLSRIRNQRNPDGSSYTPRKPQTFGGRQGRLFKKLATSRFLKLRTTDTDLTLTFTGNADRIARVSQFGLRDQVNRRGLRVQYAERQLLGLTDDEQALIAGQVLDSLSC
jgi:phage virion morphogenesis protein